jgi:hypothetical protein
MGRRADEEVARRYFEPHAGLDFTVPVNEALRLRGEAGDAAAIASMGPAWQTLSPDIEWDLTPVVGGDRNVYRGFGGFLDYWEEWLGMWNSYVYEINRYEAVGGWVVAEVAMNAEGRHGVSLDMTVAQACEVTESKIVRMRAYASLADARERLSRPGVRGIVDRLARRG